MNLSWLGPLWKTGIERITYLSEYIKYQIWKVCMVKYIAKQDNILTYPLTVFIAFNCDKIFEDSRQLSDVATAYNNEVDRLCNGLEDIMLNRKSDNVDDNELRDGMVLW